MSTHRFLAAVVAFTIPLGLLFPGLAARAGGSAGVVTTYTDPTIQGAVAITTGPGGALWFTNYESTGSSIGRITTAGVVSNYTDPTISGPVAITTGPDDALWFTNSSGNSIGRITTSGVVSNYTDASISDPEGITTGPDGALWFTNYGSIGRITTAGVISHYADPRFVGVRGIAVGSDGALWFVDGGPSAVGRITTSGAITVFYLPSHTQPAGIAAGPDRALWLTDRSGVDRITTSGVMSHFPVTASGMTRPEVITAGPDGTMWFGAGGTSNQIGQITTGGVVTSYSSASSVFFQGVTAGPDGRLWYGAGGSVEAVTTAESVTATPTQGTGGTSIIISGAGYLAGETVSVKYATGLASPAAVLICKGTVANDGTFSCTGTIPANEPGTAGSHTIAAKGKISGTRAKTVFLKYA